MKKVRRTLSIYLPEKDWKRIRHWCIDENRTISNQISHLVERWLKLGMPLKFPDK